MFDIRVIIFLFKIFIQGRLYIEISYIHFYFAKNAFFFVDENAGIMQVFVENARIMRVY